MSEFSTREEALNAVTAALPPLSQINDLYLAAKSMNQQMQVKAAKKASSRNVNGWVLLIVVTFVAYIVFGRVFAFLSSIFRGGISGLIAVAAMIGLIALVYFKAKAYLLAPRSLSKTEADVYESRMAEISQEIVRISQENEDVIEKMPRDYRYYDAVAYFEKLLANGQADSMKEAINLYEEYLHRMAMESQSEAALRQASQQSAMLADIKRSSRQTAINSGVGAAFSVANFLSR